MARILVADDLAPAALAALRDAGHEVVAEEVSAGQLLERIRGFDALLVRSRTKVTPEVLARGERLKVVGRAGVGVDNIDVPAATARRVLVVNAPAASTTAVAELALGFMLALARRIPAADRTTHAGKWEKKAFLGSELRGKTLGFVGLGRIGTEVAKRARVFGMSLVAHDPYIPKDAAAAAGVELTDLDSVLRRADYLTIHSLLTPETKGLIGGRALGLMKRGSYVLNCARGGIVDEAALIEALRSGHLGGAALDVFAQEPPTGSPLLSMENVILAPHIGASTKEAQDEAGLVTARQVVEVLAGGTPQFAVNRELLSG